MVHIKKEKKVLKIGTQGRQNGASRVWLDGL